ncbi:MAG TPA: Mur ligase family protein, partial [Candidatus Sumerlaeota bacterium]|nr:Mur ligase family protein [Candidatus Sumerlaeota bacterium]
MTTKLQDLDVQKPIHFIGVGGCGMSGIALSLRKMGYVISGSDMYESATLERLRAAGVTVNVGHNGGNIAPDTQLVVFSAAVKPDNPEYMAAAVRKIELIKYARMLGLLMASHRGIAIAGTHGKTTTTGMVALALRELGADPSFVIGGSVPQLGGGSGIGSSDYLVAEACEYDRSFLNLSPRYAIINNIEEDHLDYYSGLDEIVQAFHDFTNLLPGDGLLVYSASSPNIARFIAQAPCRTISCALDHEADYWADEIRYVNGQSLYRLHTRRQDGKAGAGERTCDVALNTFGRHNVINSLSAIALLAELGFDLEASARGVGLFRGANRRFEIIHNQGGIT